MSCAGYLEIDFVAHCGGSLSGSFIHSLVATDVCSGWTEAIPLLAREQSLVVAGIQAIGQQFPINILGVTPTMTAPSSTTHCLIFVTKQILHLLGPDPIVKTTKRG